MKKGNFTSLVLLSGALAFPAYAEKVEFEQLPSDLQEKIRAEVGSVKIEDIDRQTKDGKTIYEVGYKKDGQHTESRFEHNDTSVSAASSSPSLDSRKIRYEQLPESVKRVADAQLRGAEVNDVDRQVKNGRVTYQIGYKQADGAAQQELLLSDDGRVLSHRTAGAPTSPNNTQRTYPPGYRGTVPPSSPGSTASAHTRSMDYNQLPPKVLGVADSKLRDGHVSQVQRVIQNGQISYQIAFKKDDGRNQELVIAEDGRVLRDQFVTRSAVGSPGGIQWGSDASSDNTTQPSQYANITAPVQLLNAEEISRSAMPEAVARTVRSYTTSANIEEIRRGTWRGQDAYQIGFTDRDNRFVQLQVDDNGRVIYDPRSINKGNLLNNLGRALFNND